jgi:hypothetical protein
MVHSRSKSWDARTMTAACELLAKWEEDTVLTDGAAETERILIRDYRFAPGVAHAAILWGQGQGFTFEPEIFTDDEHDADSADEPDPSRPTTGTPDTRTKADGDPNG